MSTTLHERFAGARMGEYGGAVTAATFGDVPREYLALQDGCGLYDLGWRAKIRLTGGDRMRWLNGMVTNNVRDLALGHGVYAFLLNPQGRILGDLYAYHRGDSLLLDTDRGQLEKVLATFDHYIIMDDVEVTNVSDQLTALGVAGVKSGEVLQAAGFDGSGLQGMELRDGTSSVEVTVARGEHGYELWLAPEKVNLVWDALVAAGATPVGADAIELRRIALGIPRYGQDIHERDLPQETGQERALNFTKGCYIGQEIVERIRSRGAVHRMFTGFVIEGELPAPGTKIQVDGKEVGEITSVAALPPGERRVGLGYIRREAGTAGAEATAGAARVIVSALPFVRENT